MGGAANRLAQRCPGGGAVGERHAGAQGTDEVSCTVRFLDETVEEPMLDHAFVVCRSAAGS